MHLQSAADKIRYGGNGPAANASSLDHIETERHVSFSYLREAIPTLGVAALFLNQQGYKDISAEEVSIVQMETTASLRFDEIGYNAYTTILTNIANVLKNGASVKDARNVIIELRDELGFDNVQLASLQSLLRMPDSKGSPAEIMDGLEMSAKTRLGLCQQEGDEEGAAIYKPLLQLIQQVENMDQLTSLCESAELLNDSLSRLPS